MEFSPFGLTHLLVLVGGAAFVLAHLAFVSIQGAERRQQRFRIIAWSILIPNGFLTLSRFLPGNFDSHNSLPLDLCDLAWIIAAIGLLVHSPFPRHLSYYWGLGLSTQAIVTPTLTDGPLTLSFWEFWVSHWQIVAAGVIQLAVVKIRPEWQTFARVSGFTVVFGFMVTGINLILGSNYCFTGSRTPTHPTLVDHLGPWPARVFIMTAIVVAWFVILTLPFVVRRVGQTSANLQKEGL